MRKQKIKEIFFILSDKNFDGQNISTDKNFDGQNISTDKNFDTKPKFRHLCPSKFCPIRYI